ncbi:TdeIII family type II restriction endonuclease [Vibrio campbellii]|uniref:TdeIII family type II restriction endonuclease n=1 Tax=Vibrio campbellii TaxID=680 RepID=UPI001E64F8BE|nr:TdeIII family type II restriction endonuclease [Vibrio campbellii]MCC8255822.1 TdeIII family type II restriction endonuclease [Vibrio campbellii CAIM 333]
MLTYEQIQTLISDTVSRSIHDFFQGKEVKTTHMLDHVFPRERKIRSLIGGLETSMGTRVWEPLAKSFASHNGFFVHNEDNFNREVFVIPPNILAFIAQWEEKKLRNPTIPLSQFWVEVNLLISSSVDSKDLERAPMPKGQGVDVILTRDNISYFFDIKTTQLNAGGDPKFLRNLLCWYTHAALMGFRDIECFLAFPFDPHNGKFWIKEGGKVSPLIPNEEAYVADGFWDVLTGVKGTTAIIESTFKELGSSGFGEQFQHHFD